jgi:hypothetical protein
MPSGHTACVAAAAVVLAAVVAGCGTSKDTSNNSAAALGNAQPERETAESITKSTSRTTTRKAKSVQSGGASANGSDDTGPLPVSSKQICARIPANAVVRLVSAYRASASNGRAEYAVPGKKLKVGGATYVSCHYQDDRGPVLAPWVSIVVTDQGTPVSRLANEDARPWTIEKISGHEAAYTPGASGSGPELDVQLTEDLTLGIKPRPGMNDGSAPAGTATEADHQSARAVAVVAVQRLR